MEHQRLVDEDSHSQGTVIVSQWNRRRTKCSCGTKFCERARNAGTARTGGCELHKESKTVMTLLHRQIFCRWVLRIFLETSFSSTIGAGGFSISPKLEFRAIVPINSEIFSALHGAKERFKSQDVSTVIQTTWKALFEAFRAGKASKSDALQSGDTILHVVTGWQTYSSNWDTRSRLMWRSFIKSLLQAGLSPDRANYRGETPADSMIDCFGHESSNLEKQQITIDICSDLLEAGGYMTREALDWRHRENTFNPLYMGWRVDGRRTDNLFEDFSFRLIWRIADEKGIQDIDLPEELQPLVYKSKKLLAAQLRKGIDFHRLIESYTRWGEGLALILESGHAPTEDALKAACEANCEESVKILVNDHKCFIGNKELAIASFHPNQVIVDLIVSEFIDRRKRLQALAEANLTRSAQDQLRIESQSLLNTYAYEAYTLLAVTSVDLEGLLERFKWSVFDCVGVNLDLADRLWSAGFRGVDDIDDDNQTCLTNIWRNTPPCDLEVFLQKTNWLISKGADIYHQKPFGSALHDIANSVGTILYCMKDEEHSKINSLSEPSKALLNTVLSDNSRDDCECACSLNGCSPLTTLLSGLLPTRIDHETEAKLIQLFAEFLRVVLSHSKFKPEHDERFKSYLSVGILRFITFKSLDITHTCFHEYRKIESEEIEEIQDEEKLLISDLERLLTQFLEESNVHGLQLPSYIAGPWQTHMASFLSTSNPHCVKELTQIIESGVFLDDHKSQSRRFFLS
ncbi:hypothetical protein N7478_002173 [Penicillium angulare]|uniref:uncharacterized protein n=1 Tax=Penicillium angulare TaxID=116970 RepID=UPI0025421A41|nr:uncharacterized protein N7478_002173 [Penicillium angulare]KAJ5289143.1 hypothetical protein N7478_002173 [Penicillium angulare]